MKDIWNPWHGCIKKSEGCINCYMYANDSARGQDGSRIYKVKGNFDLPVRRNRQGEYKIPFGTKIRVCLNSDFFLEEADEWRIEAWKFIRQRSDVLFWLLTKRPERVRKCLPENWGDGWENVWFNVTIENQLRADERMPILLDLPFKHKGFMAAPLLGEIHVEKYLIDGQIESILVDGENYPNARPCDYQWVKTLYEQAVLYNITFEFLSTGKWFTKNGKMFHISNRMVQREQAIKSGMQHQGKDVEIKLSLPEHEQLKFEIFI